MKHAHRVLQNSDPSQRPLYWLFKQLLLPWFIALPLVPLTRHSYAKAGYHATMWAFLGALVLSLVFTWVGIPMGRNFAPYWTRLKLTAVTWGLPLMVAISCAFSLPAHYFVGPYVTTTVYYTVGGYSRACTIPLRFYLKAIDGTVHTCVRREEVGAVPGSAYGTVTFKQTPYGVELLKFQTQDSDRRDKWGRPLY